MRTHGISPKHSGPTVTIRVSGKLFEGHLSYLDQLITSAAECHLWPLLNLSDLQELDRAAALYLTRGENHCFTLLACPSFIRECMDNELGRAA